MKALWASILFLSLAWTFLLPVYEPSHWGWIPLLSMGLAASSFAFRRVNPQPIPRSYIAFLVPLVALAAAIPWPFNIGPCLLIVAVMSAAIVRKAGTITAISFGAGFCGLVLLAQAALWAPYSHIASRWHSISLVDPVFALILKLFKVSVVSDGDQLLVQTAKGVEQLLTTWEALGSHVLLNVGLGGALVLLIFGRPLERARRLLVILLTYAVLRYLLLLVAFASFETSDIFWLRSWLVTSFLPLPLVLMKFIPAPASMAASDGLPPLALTARKAAWAGLFAVAAMALAGALLFQDPGTRKQGRVLFDESHSDWEWMEQKYDTEWYGEKSGYNYYCLGDFLKRYYQVDIKREPLTTEFLSNYDVVVLKTPTSPYSEEEIGAIVNYVKSGGGLWLIGDHTNVFGTSTYLNPVASEFGFWFNNDATYDLASGHLSFFQPSYQTRHPVISQLPFYLFATSCSLDAPLLSENVIVGYGLKAVKGDYSQQNFFPKEAHSSTAFKHGLVLQSAARKFGAGRVLAYTDSTCFSNFYMFMPGKPELALGSIEWLNRAGKYGWVNILLLAVGLLIVCALVAHRFHRALPQSVIHAVSAVLSPRLTEREHAGGVRTSLASAPLILGALLLGVTLAVLVFGEINRRGYPRPAAHTAYPRVAFDAEHSDYYVPATAFKPGSERDMQTFYVWTQRLGIVPQMNYRFTDGFKNSDAVVVINPARRFSDAEVAEFVSYIEGGGKALLMDDPRNLQSSTAHQLLAPFGLQINYREIHNGIVEDAEGKVIWSGQHLAIVNGGQAQLFVKPVQPQTTQPIAGVKQEKGDGARLNAAAKPEINPAIRGNRDGGPAKDPNKSVVAPQPPVSNPKAPPQRFPFLTVAHRGRGTVAVLGSTTIFTGETMGSTSTIPDENRRKVYDLEYWIFRDLLAVPVQLQAESQTRR